MRLDSGWQGWDLEIYPSRYVKVRVTTATEHHADGMLTRARVELLMSKFCAVLMLAGLMLTGLLLLHLYPFSRPALLIPMVGWTMYVTNRWRVARPVLGLMDEAAERAGFYPVPNSPLAPSRSAAPTAKPQAAAALEPVTDDAELEDATVVV
jgi:hypothetical protein